MTKALLRGLGVVFVLAAITVAAACSGDGDASPDEPGGAGATTATAPTLPATEDAPVGPKPKRPTRVRVVLGAPQEFSLIATPSRIPAGPTVFTVVNRGTVEHELVILKTAARAADLTPEQIVHGNEEGRVNEHPEHQEPGTTMTIRVDMKPGHYSMICNVAGHYQAGQFADFTVV